MAATQLVLCLSLISAVSALTVTYSCTPANALTLTVGGREAGELLTIAYMAGSSSTDPDCSNTLTPGATDDAVFSFTLDTSLAKCGLQYDAAGVFTGIIWIKKTRSVVQNGDAYSNLAIRCEGPAQDVDVTVTSVTDTSSIITAAETQGDENMVLTATMADGSAISGSVSMTDSIVLVATLTQKNPAEAIAARVSDCTVKATSASTNSVKLITQYCGDATLGVLANNVGFTGVAATGVAPSVTQVSTSAAFSPFLIEGDEAIKSMFITCRCVFCSAGDSTCIGNQCPTAKRRRRDVDEEGNSTVVTASLNIQIGPSSGEPQQNIAANQNAELCTSQTVFIATTSIIAAVLLLAVAVIVFMFTRLSRTRENPDPKVGVANPAF